MADDCDNSFGGMISVTVDGTRYSPTEADIIIDPTNLSVEGKANQDGSACYTAKPKLYKWAIKFRQASGIKWDDNMRKCSVDATISEDTNNRTHIMTGGRFTGEPSLNLSTGEVDGVNLEGPRYQPLNS